MDDVGEHLRAIPVLAGCRPEDMTVTRLGGLTNLVYQVESGDAAYVLRIPGKGTEAYIDRSVEAHNAEAAARAGVSPEVLFCDPSTGVMLSRFIDAETMSPASFRSTPGAPARAAEAMRRMHQSGETFRFRFEVFEMIDEYLAILAGLETKLPDGYGQTVERADSVRKALQARPAMLAPCHCDPLTENFLDDGRRMWIVDWEYSGMNDPFWDLGDLAVEAGLDADEDMEMLTAYCKGTPSAAQVGRMTAYKALCDLLWTLWGLIQHANDNPADDFWSYAMNRYDRCRTLQAKPEFQRHLDAIARG